MMRFTPTLLAILSGIWLASPLQACFFCEEGAYNTALFVLTFFGMFMAGMLFICIAYARAGAFKTDNELELRVLEVEGIELGTGGEED